MIQVRYGSKGHFDRISILFETCYCYWLGSIGGLELKMSGVGHWLSESSTKVTIVCVGNIVLLGWEFYFLELF